MSSTADLRIRTVKELAEMARKQKILGWHDMRKEELVTALLRQAKKAAAKRNSSNGPNRSNGIVGKHGQSPNGQSKNGHSQNGHSQNGRSQNGHSQNGSPAVIAKGDLANGHSSSEASVPLETAEKQALLATEEIDRKGAEAPQPSRRASVAADQGPPGRGEGPGVPRRGRIAERRQRPAGGDGPRSVLAARLLGVEPAEHSAGRGGDGPALACRPTGAAAARGQPQRHDQRRATGRARHRNPRRREQLVHRRAESAQELPGGNRLPGPRQPLSIASPAATW